MLRDEDKVGGARHRLLGPIVAGALVVLVSYSGPMFIIQEAARNAGLSAGQASSWIFTVSVGSGVAGLVLSVLLRQPIVVAFSSAGAVLLSSSLGTYRYGDAIGAYLVVSLACVAIGLSSTFGRLMARVPAPIVSAMLAGVLFRFGTGYFAALPGSPARARVTVLVALMGATYFVARSRGSRLTIVWTALVGVVATVALRLTTGASVALAVVRPEATRPTLHAGAVIGLALPLLAIALSSQFAPGYGVLKEAGYEPRMNPVLAVTGAAGALLAPFGCPGLNLAAITAGLATGPDAHPDPARRYLAGVWAGLFYVAVGVFGASALSMFASMPQEFVAAVTGLGLFGTIVSSAATAFSDPAQRDAAGVTLLCAAAGFSLFHVASPFWALVAGLAVSALAERRRTVGLPGRRRS
ncbi:MAG: benzoate/H(+) symporter BenE family transporter [Acidimicrobiales bacterium]|nr:benzoate/H(+) symporter BenE family transporter [Acidimicrobiales bacterium]